MISLGEQMIQTVLGTASVVADSFSNSGTIAVSNSSFVTLQQLDLIIAELLVLILL